MDLDLEAPPGKAKIEKPARGKKEKLEARAVAQIIASGLGLYGMTRPEPLRPAWVFDVNECMDAAEPLAKSFEALPTKYVKKAANLLNPFAAVLAIYSLYSIGVQRERMLADEYLRATGRKPGQEGAARVPEPNSNGTGGEPSASAKAVF